MRNAAELLRPDLHVMDPQEGLRRAALLMHSLGLEAVPAWVAALQQPAVLSASLTKRRAAAARDLSARAD